MAQSCPSTGPHPVKCSLTGLSLSPVEEPGFGFLRCLLGLLLKHFPFLLNSNERTKKKKKTQGWKHFVSYKKNIFCSQLCGWKHFFLWSRDGLDPISPWPVTENSACGIPASLYIAHCFLKECLMVLAMYMDGQSGLFGCLRAYTWASGSFRAEGTWERFSTCWTYQHSFSVFTTSVTSERTPMLTEREESDIWALCGFAHNQKAREWEILTCHVSFSFQMLFSKTWHWFY